MYTNKQIYKAVEAKGEGDYKNAHVIYFVSPPEGDEGFRFYHKDGYCVDITKEYVCEPFILPKTKEQEDGYVYHVTQNFEGFKNITPKHLLDLISELEL
jgi:hypothetical protein